MSTYLVEHADEMPAGRRVPGLDVLPAQHLDDLVEGRAPQHLLHVVLVGEVNVEQKDLLQALGYLSSVSHNQARTVDHSVKPAYPSTHTQSQGFELA